MEPHVPARQRNRATSACVPCRKSRIRCIKGTHERKCKHCQENQQECHFDEKDGRKSRTSAKAIEIALSHRIRLLEQRLREHQTASRREAERAAAINLSAIDLLPAHGEPPPPYQANSEGQQEALEGPGTGPDLESETGNDRGSEYIPSIVQTLTPRPARLDFTSGHARHFGLTTGINVLSKLSAKSSERQHETHWPMCHIVRQMSPSTHNYLMDLFWACHNSVVHLVHLEAFYQDQELGGTEFYSSFLHQTMLAIAIRYADKARGDIRRLFKAGSDMSVLHEQAIAIAKVELDQPGSIASIQAFQLLGDLEFHKGRDDTGWMYIGISFRMVFQSGLHVDPRHMRLSEREAQIRHMVLWASLIADKFWSIYLGRPTTLKRADISPACLSFDFKELLACGSSGREKKVGTRIYEQLLRLMDLASPLSNAGGLCPFMSTESYLKMMSIADQVKSWYLALPEDLKWPSGKQATMPPSYFILHTQYHTIMILIHQPFSTHEGTVSAETAAEDCGISQHFIALSRSATTEHARRIAAIFDQYTFRFNPRQIFGTAVIHTGTATTTLMLEAARLHETGMMSVNSASVEETMVSLTSLRTILSAMAHNYEPAVVTLAAVDQFLINVETMGDLVFNDVEAGDLSGNFEWQDPMTGLMDIIPNIARYSDPSSQPHYHTSDVLSSNPFNGTMVDVTDAAVHSGSVNPGTAPYFWNNLNNLAFP